MTIGCSETLKPGGTIALPLHDLVITSKMPRQFHSPTGETGTFISTFTSIISDENSGTMIYEGQFAVRLLVQHLIKSRTSQLITITHPVSDVISYLTQ